MTQFYAMTPKQAMDAIAAAGVEDAARLIRDHAAAGLVKSYAQIQVTLDARGERRTVRGAAVAAETWERMIRDGLDGDVWGGGTVRLAGSELIGGIAALHVTGIAFNPADVERLARQQRPTPQPSQPVKHERAPAMVAAIATPTQEPTPGPTVACGRKVPDLTALHAGALHLTVAQTKAALSIGHTTLYKLLNAGNLERAPSKAGTRITAESVRRYAGLSGQEQIRL